MKIPKLFGSELSERRFHRQILRRIHVESEREFVLGLYSRGEDGLYRRLREPGDEELRRLARLARSIKGNRGVVRGGRVSLILIVMAAILVFNLAFKNRLLENALERGLEDVFGARAEVEKLDLRLLAGRLSFAHLSIADREQPFRNLFELGATELNLRTAELLKAKVVVSNLESRDVRWHTRRQSSGALPGAGGAAEPQPAGAAAGAGFSLKPVGPGPRALVEEQFDRLDSPKRIAELNRRLDSARERWRSELDDSRTRLDRIAGDIDSLRSMDVEALGTAEELRRAVADIGKAADGLNRAGEDIRSAHDRLEAERQDIAAARRSFEQAVEADVAYLGSLSDPSTGELKNLISDTAAGYLRQILGRWYGYARDAGGYADRLISGGKGGRRERRKVDRSSRGMNIHFAEEVYPRFLLEHGEVSLSGTSKTILGSIRNISSDPDLIDRPVSFTFMRAESERRLSVEGVLDRRTARERDLILSVRAAGYPLELSSGLEKLGLRSLSGFYRFQTDLHISREGGSVEGEGRLELYDLTPQAAPEAGTVAEIIYETLGAVSTLDVQFHYTLAGGAPARITASSSLDRELAAALQGRFTKIAAGPESRLREELAARLAPEIRENEALSRAFAGLVASSEENLAALEGQEAVVADKRAAVEQRITGGGGKAGEALKSQLEKLPVPRLGF